MWETVSLGRFAKYRHPAVTRRRPNWSVCTRDRHALEPRLHDLACKQCAPAIASQKEKLCAECVRWSLRIPALPSQKRRTFGSMSTDPNKANKQTGRVFGPMKKKKQQQIVTKLCKLLLPIVTCARSPVCEGSSIRWHISQPHTVLMDWAG